MLSWAVMIEAPAPSAAPPRSAAGRAVDWIVSIPFFAMHAGALYCSGADPGGAVQSPSREFMARLGSEPTLRRAAECDRRAEGAVEATTRRPAIIVTAGPIEWVDHDEAWVVVSYFRSATQSARRRYRVVREREGWVSLGPILLDGPA